LNDRIDEITATEKTGRIKLVAFDMDGVLVDIVSSWQHIHDYFETNNRESVISYIKGDIDYSEFICRDANLWTNDGKPVNVGLLNKILSDAPLMNGAKRCVKNLKRNGVVTCIVSAGLDLLANKVAEELGIDHVFANGIGLDNDGFFNGEGRLGVELLYKDKIIFEISEKFEVELESIGSVGNSCFDIPMLRVSGLGVAFNPSDDCVRGFSDVVVEGKDLFDVFLVLEKYI